MNRVFVQCGALALVLAWLVVGIVDVAAAQDEEPDAPPALLLIMDSSGSMQADAGDGRTKLAAAKRALVSLVDDLPDDVNVGLRVYGHRVPNTDKRRGCKDTELIVPVGPLDRSGTKRTVRSFDAKGFTPIGLSLRKGARDLPPEGKRTIVLVSDGIDTCAPPNPCRVARRITARGIDLRIDTVGFQVNPRARRQLECIARVGKGTYVDAPSASELSKRLQQLSVRALRRYETAGLEVEGGTGPEDAPALLPGQYVDGIGVEADEWYAVYLGDGQVVRASATFVGQGSSSSGPLNTIETRVYGPDGEGSLELGDGSDPKKAQIGGPPKTVFVETLPVGSSEDYAAPGWYYLQVQTSAEGPDTDFPLELRVGIYDRDGTPAEAVLPSGEEGETESPNPSGPRAAPDRSRDAATPLPAAAAFLVPAFVGAAVGIVLGGRARGSQT